MRCVALLRGINVGGANKVSMAELKAAFESAGMSAVRTYINSGNVIFSADTSDRAQLTRLLQETTSERLGEIAPGRLRHGRDSSTEGSIGW